TLACWAMMRATTSVAPPAGNGTIMRTERSGHSDAPAGELACAWALSGRPNRTDIARQPRAAALSFKNLRIAPPPFMWITLWFLSPLWVLGLYDRRNNIRSGTA